MLDLFLLSFCGPYPPIQSCSSLLLDGEVVFVYAYWHYILTCVVDILNKHLSSERSSHVLFLSYISRKEEGHWI